jgi:hypothetical protein
VPRLRKRGAIHSLFHTPSWRSTGTTLALLIFSPWVTILSFREKRPASQSFQIKAYNDLSSNRKLNIFCNWYSIAKTFCDTKEVCHFSADHSAFCSTISENVPGWIGQDIVSQCFPAFRYVNSKVAPKIQIKCLFLANFEWECLINLHKKHHGNDWQRNSLVLSVYVFPFSKPPQLFTFIICFSTFNKINAT